MQKWRTLLGQGCCHQQRWGGSNGWNLLIISQSQQPKLYARSRHVKLPEKPFRLRCRYVWKTLLCWKHFQKSRILWLSFLQKWPLTNWFPANESFALTVQLVVQFGDDWELGLHPKSHRERWTELPVGENHILCMQFQAGFQPWTSTLHTFAFLSFHLGPPKGSV